jgi:hypothetical protein
MIYSLTGKSSQAADGRSKTLPRLRQNERPRYMIFTGLSGLANNTYSGATGGLYTGINAVFYCICFKGISQTE